jgi:hypothetical protein
VPLAVGLLFSKVAVVVGLKLATVLGGVTAGRHAARAGRGERAVALARAANDGPPQHGSDHRRPAETPGYALIVLEPTLPVWVWLLILLAVCALPWGRRLTRAVVLLAVVVVGLLSSAGDDLRR